MKITKIIIPEYRQFKSFELDLTYPEGHAKAGQPFEKVCFIGRNGTGKTILLKTITNFLINFLQKNSLSVGATNAFFQIEFQKHRYYIHFQDIKSYFSDSSTENLASKFVHFYLKRIKDENIGIDFNLEESINFENVLDNQKQWEEFVNKKKHLLMFAFGTESTHEKEIKNIPIEKCKDSISENNFYSLDKHQNAWNLITLSASKADNFLKALSVLWNQILAKCGLYFDYEDAKKPIQLLDNLHAYIKHTGTNRVIAYHELSTGIRNFIFRLGHIFSIYFNREVESGFLLVDEPENSLFPDFKRDLIEIYLDIIKGKNTQFFVATHDPIIAAQFEPCERVILDFDEEGFVSKYSTGTAPEGDDANDILSQDFGTNTMTKKGMEMWDEYLRLRKELRKTTDEMKVKELMHKISTLANTYNFP
jgi:predicted ATPase